MKTAVEIAARLDEIVKDSRFQARSATTFENAPLALIQMGMESEVKGLCWVLGLERVPAKWWKKK